MEGISNESRDAAAQALAFAANEGQDPEGWGDEPSQPDSSVTGDESSDPGQSDVTQAPASQIDLSQLPEEARLYLQAREREMTADYTRKTQEAARQRQEAEQALQFIEALNTDPQFGQALYERLAQEFNQGGYGGQDQYGYDPDEDPYAINDDVDDPYLRELAELKQWKEDLDAQIRTAQIEANLDRQIAEIRSADPTITDDDMNDILGMGIATNGDLHAAHQSFQALKQRLLAGYLDTKSSVTAPAVVPQSSGAPAGTVFDDITTLEDPRLRQIALERMRNELG